LWGILGIVDDQVSEGAGHQYLRDRLWYQDWIAIGFLDKQIAIVPPIRDAKFGRKSGARFWLSPSVGGEKHLCALSGRWI
jgi:hypothetical protein